MCYLTNVCNCCFWRLTSRETSFSKVSEFVSLGIGLCDNKITFFIGIKVLIISFEKTTHFESISLNVFYDILGEFWCYKCLFRNNYFSMSIHDIIESDTIYEFFFIYFYCMKNCTERSRDKSILINTSVWWEVEYETDVWSFWCCNWTDASVLCRVYITNFERCTLTCETPDTECRNTTLMWEFWERIRLIHELWELVRTEELAHHGNHGTWVDKTSWNSIFEIRDDSHTILGNLFHTSESYLDLVVDELTNWTNTTILEVIDIIDIVSWTFITEREEVLETIEKILSNQEHLRFWSIYCSLMFSKFFWELSICLDTCNCTEFELFWIIKCRLKELFNTLISTEISWTQELVDSIECFHASFCLVLLESWSDMLRNPLIFTLECIQYICIRLISPSTKKYWYWDLSLFVDFDIDNSTFFDLDLEPRTALRDNLHRKKSWIFLIWSEKHTSRTYNLIDDHTLDTIDDKCSHLSHKWYTSEIYILLFDLPCLLVEHLESSLEWCFVVEIFTLTICHRVFWFLEWVVLVVDCYLLTWKVLDRKYLVKSLIELDLEKVSIAIKLYLDESWKFENCTVICEVVSPLVTINFPKTRCLRCDVRNLRFFCFCHGKYVS